MDRNKTTNQIEKKECFFSGKNLLILAVLLCAASLAAMMFALHTHRSVPYAPPSFDADAQSGVPDVPDGLGWQELDAQAYRFSVCGVFAPVNGIADIYLTNPKDSGVWMKLRVLDAEGNMLGETGLLRSGEYVRSVKLQNIPDMGETVVMKLMAYEPDTYHSAGAVSLNTVVTQAEEVNTENR